MQNKTYGYIRVSTKEQHDDRQRIALDAFGVPPENVFADKMSGKDFERPAWKRLMQALRPDDLLVVNIKTSHLIQSQTRMQTTEVLATRASVVFYCPADTLFCQQAGVAQTPIR